MEYLTAEDVPNLFKSLFLVPDFSLKLQEKSINFRFKECYKKINAIPNNKISKKFVYSFFKTQNDDIKALYIGMSKKGTVNRLINHLKGLKQYLQNDQSDFDSFYSRFYHKFFKNDQNLPIYLLIFNWDPPRKLKNVFPFDIKVNCSNAEALLVSNFSFTNKNALLNHEYISRTKWAKKSLSTDRINQDVYLQINGVSALELWREWCEFFFLKEDLSPKDLTQTAETKEDLEHIPLFKTDQKDRVKTFIKGRTNKKEVFEKSEGMKRLITESCKFTKKSYDYFSSKSFKMVEDPEMNPLFTDGLIYMMYTLNSEVKDKSIFNNLDSKYEYIPIYIGKTETLGRSLGYSTNLKGVHKGNNPNCFARWGYGDARHIGGLSLRFFKIPNNYPSTDYEEWINLIFDLEERKHGVPKLKIPVYFQIKPWFPYNISFAKKLEIFTPELETYLIALCRNLFPDLLSNKQGR